MAAFEQLAGREPDRLPAGQGRRETQHARLRARAEFRERHLVDGKRIAVGPFQDEPVGLVRRLGRPADRAVAQQRGRRPLVVLHTQPVAIFRIRGLGGFQPGEIHYGIRPVHRSRLRAGQHLAAGLQFDPGVARRVTLHVPPDAAVAAIRQLDRVGAIAAALDPHEIDAGGVDHPDQAGRGLRIRIRPQFPAVVQAPDDRAGMGGIVHHQDFRPDHQRREPVGGRDPGNHDLHRVRRSSLAVHLHLGLSDRGDLHDVISAAAQDLDRRRVVPVVHRQAVVPGSQPDFQLLDPGEPDVAPGHPGQAPSRARAVEHLPGRDRLGPAATVHPQRVFARAGCHGHPGTMVHDFDRVVTGARIHRHGMRRILDADPVGTAPGVHRQGPRRVFNGDPVCASPQVDGRSRNPGKRHVPQHRGAAERPLPIAGLSEGHVFVVIRMDLQPVRASPSRQSNVGAQTVQPVRGAPAEPEDVDAAPALDPGPNLGGHHIHGVAT